MATVTDFTRFFDDLSIERYSEVEDLRQSLELGLEVGRFRTRRKGIQFLVEARDCETVLRLHDEEERATFLEILGERFIGWSGQRA